MSDVIVIGWLSLDYIARPPVLPGAGDYTLSHDLDAACGGRAANQAMAVAALEADASLLARVGSDQYAEVLLEELADIGVDVDMIVEAPAVTGLRIIIDPDDGQDPATVVHPGANEYLTADDVNRRADALRATRAIGVTTEAAGSVALRALDVARQAGVPAVLTHTPGAGISDRLMAAADVIVVSASMAVGVLDPALAAERPEHAARVLLQRGARTVVLLAGQSALIASGEQARHVASQSRLDEEDAADAFVGGLLLGLSSGETPDQAVERGVRVAGLLVG